MILGFIGDINNDTHRVLLTRLANQKINFRSTKSTQSPSQYTILFETESDYKNAQKVAKVMAATFIEKIPLFDTI